MKTKMRFHAEAVEILNKPGRYNVLTQWTDGGAINCDTNNGLGYGHEEASALIVKLRGQTQHKPAQ